MTVRRFVAGLTLATAVACAREKAPVAKAPAADTDEPVVTPAATPAAAPSKIGQMPLFGYLPPDGKCSITRYGGLSAVRKEVTFSGGYPERSIRVALADPSRGFPTVNLKASMTRAAAGGEESEILSVIFSPEGHIQSGVRQYLAPTPGDNETGPLMQDDSTQVFDLARQVLDQCRDSL